MNTGWIYIIKNKINNKVYIGQTLTGVEERYKQHMKPSATKKSYKIYKAIAKYGSNNFYYEILESNVPEDVINDREIYWIETFDSFEKGYNSNTGWEGRSIYSNLDVEYIKSELIKGKQVKEIALELKVNTHTINRTLKRVGIDKPTDIQNTKIALGKAQRQVDRDIVYKLRLEGISVNDISSRLKCNTKTIRRILKELNMDVDMPRYDYSKINDDYIINDRLNNIKVADILTKYNISYGYYFKIWKAFREAKNSKLNDYPDRE